MSIIVQHPHSNEMPEYSMEALHNVNSTRGATNGMCYFFDIMDLFSAGVEPISYFHRKSCFRASQFR